jgi:hypothetical protein
MQIDATWDIETYKWTQFVLGGWYDKDGFKYFRDEKLYFEHILNYKGTIWAHNAGHFDSLWFIQKAIDLEIKPIKINLQGSRVLRAQIRKVTLMDSMGLLPFSLEKAGKIVDSKKLELPFGFEKMNDLNPEEFAILIDYLRQDCKLLWDILHTLKGFADDNNIILRNTIGSTSWNNMFKNLGKKIGIKWGIGEWNFSRKGYFGGRTEVYKIQSDKGYRYDRNSSYPAALVETALPMGRHRQVGRKAATSAFTGRCPGIYRATVSVPDEHYYPVLPLRTEERLLFPTGKFTGEWTLIELQYAEQCGVKIQDITFALIWETSDYILQKWCQNKWDLRANCGNDGLSMWLKWLMNSLTGKLGERADKSRVIFSDENTEPVFCDGHKNKCNGINHPAHCCCEHRCIGKCGKWDAIGSDGKVWSKKVWSIPRNSYPHWSAYLTASARISLHKQLTLAGNHGVYCDTDSVICENEIFENIGQNLGQWKLEGNYQNWVAIAPKLYRYNDGDVAVIKGKGFPQLTDEGFIKLKDGETLEIGLRPETFKMGLKRGQIWNTRLLKKGLHPKDGFIGGRLIDDGSPVTYPSQAYEKFDLLK